MKQIDRIPIVTLPEWRTQNYPDLALTPGDQALVEVLSGSSEARLAIDELKTGLRLGTRSWVGVVRLSNFELRIVPKLAGGDVGLVRLIDFARGLDALKQHPTMHSFEAESANLLDLVALLLAEACEAVLRKGLVPDYHEVEEDLPVVRGRLLVRRQVLHRFGRIDRIECRYDDHTTQTIDNQLLLAALQECARRVKHPNVALRVRRLLAVFSEVCSLEGLDLRVVRSTLSYNRLNEHYREAHALAWLALDGLGIDDIYSGGAYRTFAFLLDMNRVFEDFVTRWLRWLLRGRPFRVHAQRQDRSILWNAELARPHGQITPDITIEAMEGGHRHLPIDAKYKLYDQRRIDPADIYQTFTYASAFGERHSTLPTAIILYPASSTSPGSLRLQVRRPSRLPQAEIHCLGIDIQTTLEEVAKRAVSPLGLRIMQHIAECLA